MAEAVIVAAARTPIGRARKGSLVDVRPDDLAAFAIRSAVDQVPELDASEIVDVMVGCGYPEQRQGMNLARRAALLADLPASAAAPPSTASAPRACRRFAWPSTRSGPARATRTWPPASSRSPRSTATRRTPKSCIPGLTGSDDAIGNVYIPMGMTAENVAERFGVEREEMDRFAQRSQERAVAAQESGHFAREITPYTKEDGTVVSSDDGPRPQSTLEGLSQLEPAFKEDGKVTAGNSCPLNDGGAAVVVMSDSRAKELGITPKARIVASAVSGIDPEIMGVGPIEAVRRVLKQAGMKIDDVDVMELNEAFAAQVIPVCREVGIDPFDDRFNPHGGAIALGHPYGMTGARIMCTLLNDLDAVDGTVGLETMCVGGGQGMAMIVERV